MTALVLSTRDPPGSRLRRQGDVLIVKDGMDRITAGRFEARTDVVGEVVIAQRIQGQGASLTVERAFAAAEDLGHNSRMRSGEDVARDLAMMLDTASEEGVEPVVRGQQAWNSSKITSTR